eukprot:gene13056-13183_t
MFGTINIDPKYTLGSEHYVLEGAKRLLAIGSTVYKFQLRPQLADLRYLDLVYRGFMRIIQNPLLPYKQVLDLPFRTFIMSRPPSGVQRFFNLDAYKETYELAKYFLT